MLITGYLFIFLVGIFLGALGAGGAIFSIPIFIYLFKFNLNDAISLSYLITCITALLATIFYFKDISWHKHTYFFIVPAVLMTWVMRHHIIPILEQSLNIETINFYMMILLSCLMLLSAFAMFKHIPRGNRLERHYYWDVILAMFYGSLVGSIGSGGGFLLIPTFRLLMGMHLTQAVATSLSLIALTTLFGMEANTTYLEHISNSFIILITLISIMGMVVGIFIHEKCLNKYLDLLFIIALISTGLIILINQFCDLQLYFIR